MDRRRFCHSLGGLLGAGLLFPFSNVACCDSHEGTASAFPVRIQGALGNTIIDAPPKRVIALGAGAEDIALSLGVVPIAIEPHVFGGDKQGYFPWFKEKIKQIGAPLPEIIPVYPELDIEKIISLKPDLILAPQSGFSEDIFRQLSSFVPVVAHPKLPWLTPWQEQIRLSGLALGKVQEAVLLEQKIHNLFLLYRQQYPQLQRYSFAYLNAGSRLSYLSSYVAGDPRVDMLMSLGLKLFPAVKEFSVRPGSFAANIGLENADKFFDVDIVISWFYNQKIKEEVDKIPLFRAIPAIRRGSYIPLTDPEIIMATSYGSLLSLEWGLPKFMPLLLQAIENVPTKRGAL